MDPITLILAAAAGLGVFGVTSEIQANAEAGNDELLIRKLYDWDSGWQAVELSSEGSLKTASGIFDIDMADWWPAVKSGMSRVVIISQVGGPPKRATIACFSRAGRYGWTLEQSYRMGYRKVNDDGSYQRISELLVSVLNADPAREVADAAMAMTPVKRYEYLRRVLMANPYLSAALATSPLFKDLVIATVMEPSVQRLTGQTPLGLPAPALAVRSPQIEMVSVEEEGIARPKKRPGVNEEFRPRRLGRPAGRRYGEPAGFGPRYPGELITSYRAPPTFWQSSMSRAKNFFKKNE